MATLTSYSEFSQGATSDTNYPVLAESSTFTGYTITDQKDDGDFVVPVSYNDAISITLNGSTIALDVLYGFVTGAYLGQGGFYTPNDLSDVETSFTSQSLSGKVSAAQSGGFDDINGAANATSGTGYLVISISDLSLGAAGVQNDFTVNLVGPPPPLPNLVAVNNGFINSKLPVQGEVQLSLTVRNTGSADAAASTLNIYFCDSINFATAKVFSTLTLPIDPIAAGGSITQISDFTLPPELAPGSYYVFLKANADGSVVESDSGDNLSSWAELNVTPPALFTPSADTVDFNALTSGQIFAIANGANKYDALGGDDTVTLPNEAHEYYTLPGTDYQFVWYDSLQSQFETSTLAGQHTTVNGSDGIYYVTLGTGDDTVNIVNPTPTKIGLATIVCGAGHDTVNIHGDNGDNGVTSGAGALTLNIDGYGNNKLQLEGLDPGAIDGTIVTSANPYIANNGSFTFQFLLAGDDVFNGALSGDGEANVFGGQLTIAHDETGHTGDFTIQQGTLELKTPGGAGVGRIVFENNIGGDILQIDGTAMPANIIVGFNNQQHQKIDLRGVAYTGAGAAKISTAGVLSVTPDASKPNAVFKLNLDPGNDYSQLTPVLYEDGYGGTLIDYAQVVGSGASVSIEISVAWYVNGRIHDSTVDGGGTAVIAAAGVATTTVILKGGKVIVNANARSVYMTVQAGAFESVYGRDLNADVSGTLTVLNAGFAYGITVKGGGVVTVLFGGKTVNAVIQTGGALGDTGRVLSATVTSGAGFSVKSGGFSTNVVVQSQATFDVQGGGRSLQDQIVTGGAATVEGRAINDRVSGALTVANGGYASGTLIATSATETVALGARTSGETVDADAASLDYGRVLNAAIHGTLTVKSGGFVADAIVDGDVVVESGGVARDLTISGGFVEVDASSTLTGDLTFAGAGGRLFLQTQDSLLHATVYGFGQSDAIEIGDIDFKSSTFSSAFSGSTLTVTDGTKTRSIAFAGGDYSAASFHFDSYGVYGTAVEFAS